MSAEMLEAVRETIELAQSVALGVGLAALGLVGLCLILEAVCGFLIWLRDRLIWAIALYEDAQRFRAFKRAITKGRK